MARIAVLSTYDRAGGAERVAFDLHRSYRERGHDARLFVRYKFTKDQNVFELEPYKQTLPWSVLCAALERQVRSFPRFRGQYRLVDWLRRIASPQRLANHLQGFQDFDYPYSHHLLSNPDWCPDVIHAHNLHGDYFDLNALISLSSQVPVIWTLHDTWAITGHCGYFIDCERWRTGCGHCPDLTRPPAIQRDRTAENWLSKRRIYVSSRLAAATSTRWLMDQVDQSMLRPWKKRVIAQGIDLAVFRPGDHKKARNVLGLPQDMFICMFAAASGNAKNPYKDYNTVDRAMRKVARQLPTGWMLVCLGNTNRSVVDSRFLYTGYITVTQQMAMYYQAADVLLHAANAEVFGLVLAEAQACGTPVIATAVGGIPEIIEDGKTGFLVPRHDNDAMAQRIIELVKHPNLSRQMGQTAAAHAQHTYSLDRQAETYLTWFDEVRAEYGRGP